MKIVVGGQIDKEDIASIVRKELGDQAEVHRQRGSGCHHGYEVRTV